MFKNHYMFTLKFNEIKSRLLCRSGMHFFSIYAIALLGDQLTKFYAQRILHIGKHHEVRFLSLYYNRGMAFSLMESYPALASFIALLALCIFTVLCLHLKRTRTILGVALLLAGAWGNALDRVIHQHVIDWFYIGVHANLADVFLCCGFFFTIFQLSSEFLKGGEQ